MIQFEPDGNVAVIRLDRPAKLNALTPAMLGSLAGAFDRATSADAVVLSGVGETFCAGFDLTLCRDDDGALAALLEGLSRVIVSMRTTPSPVVVSAHGAAIAGGCALLGGGDLVVTNEAAKLGYPVLKLGISPAVSAPFLRLSVGDGGARTRLLEPAVISGNEALRIGLAHECLASGAACEGRALELARAMAAKPRDAMRWTKAWLNELAGWSTSRAALETSLSLVGGAEESRMLPQAWNRGEGKQT
ncbi:MAG: enoyl-CoA hydratase/isomerase family protein [Phycisphaerales bacterium]